MTANETVLPTKPLPVELPHPACTCGKPHDFEAIVMSCAKAVKLSPKETEVLVLLFKGFEYQEIAEALGNTHQSIKSRVGTIMEKFDVGSRMELVNVIYPL